MPWRPRRVNERRLRRLRVRVRRSTRSSASNCARPGRFGACAARPSGPLFRERREKTATLAGNVSGGSATARRVARDVLRDARRDRFPAPALTSFVPDLAETRRRPIQEPHPRGAQRQLPLAHQRRREEGTDETLRGRSTVALPRSADLRAVSTGEIRGRRLTVALSQFPSRGFHRRWFFWLFFVSLARTTTLTGPHPTSNRARRTRE